MAAPRFTVTATEPGPIHIPGLFSVAPPQAADGKILGGVEHESHDCSFPSFTSDGCIGGYVPGHVDGEPYDEKEYDGVPEWTNGESFVVYKGVQCFLGDRSYDDDARKLLENTEEYGVQRAFADTILADIDPLVPAAAAIEPDLAIALLEQHIVSSQVRGAVLHAATATATLLLTKGLLEMKDGKLFTKLGTPVNAGLPYDAVPAGKTTAGISSWVFLTGAVNIWRTEIEVNPGTDYLHNLDGAIAERGYAITIGCGATAILTNTPSALS